MVTRAHRYLLDSVIVIDHFNGINAATDFICRYGHESCLSVVTRAEVLTGFENEQGRAQCSQFFRKFDCHSIEVSTADWVAQIRRRLRLKMADAMQAALSIEHGLTLVTRNIKDFREGMPLVKVWVPYTV